MTSRYCLGCKKKIRWWQDYLQDDLPLINGFWHVGCFLLVVYKQLNERCMNIEAHSMALCDREGIHLI